MAEGRVTESSSRICQLLMIHMTGGAPFGFRIASIHSDGISPFAVSTIRINGKAYRAGLLEADLVLAINGFSCYSGLSHHSATKLMEYDDPELTLHILRGNENFCERDIEASLKSLESQIVELTDNEVQSIISKKQLQQPVGTPVWKSKLANNLNHLNACSSSWLQPPPITRPKTAERRSDMLSLSQTREQSLTDFAPNGMTDNRIHQIKLKTETNIDTTGSLAVAPVTMTKATESNKDFHLCDKPINELRSANFDCLYQLNEAEKQGRLSEVPSSLTLDNGNNKLKATTGHFDMASSLTVSHGSIDGRVEEAGQNIQLQQQLKNKDNHLRNRYRVEHNIVFKPADRARYYDTESGQFRENSSDKLPKRRSNSISCYHMYMGSGTPKPSSTVENSRGHFQQPDESNRWRPGEDSCKQFPDGTVYQWANGAAKDSVTEFNQGVSKSSSTSIRLPQATSPSVSNVHLPSSLNQSPQFNQSTMRLPHITGNSPSLWSSKRPDELTTEHLQASSNKWETRSLLQAAPSVSSFSPAIDNLPSSLRPNSLHCLPVSTAKFLPASPIAAAVLNDAPLDSTRNSNRTLPPTMISLRSNEDETPSASVVCTNVLPFNETTPTLATVRPSQRYSGMKSGNYDAHMRGSSRSRANYTSDFETNQHRTQPQEISEPVYYHSAHKPNSSINQMCPVNANSNSLKTLLINEGKGGRLFARRRANSDAWIVGERDEPNKTAAQSTMSNKSNVMGLQVTPEPDVMQRRRSLTAGYLQQPVLSEIGIDPRQCRSRPAQKPMNSFSSPRQYYDLQYANRPGLIYPQSSAEQIGVNQAVRRHHVDLNEWQRPQGRTTADRRPTSPSNSQRVRPLQAADLHPTYHHHATEGNRYAGPVAQQPNTGCCYTDL